MPNQLYKNCGPLQLLDEINRQLLEKGVLVRTDTIMDASFIQAAARPGNKKKNLRIRMSL